MWLRRYPGILLLLIALGTAAPAPAAPAADYEALPAPKALAVAPAQPETVHGLTHSQPHELAASVRAMEQCDTAAGQAGPCELLWLNDQRITTGAEILAQVPDTPHPLFLWHYRRGAVELFLAGSIHVLKPSLYPLPAQLEAAFEQSDRLVVEVDAASVGQRELVRRTQAHALLPPGQTLAEVLPAPLLGRLERHLADYGIAPAMVSAMKPAMVMNHIVVSRLLTLGYQPDTGVESHFLSRRGDRQVLELESLDDQLELLFGQPMPTQIQLLAETLDVEDEIEPMLAGMLVAWLSGDDDTFLELFKAQSGDSPLSREFTRRLLDERNHAMADGIADYLRNPPTGPTTYFVLVGAAHLVGEQGIVPLLARQGFEGRRIMSDETVAAVEEAP